MVLIGQLDGTLKALPYNSTCGRTCASNCLLMSSVQCGGGRGRRQPRPQTNGADYLRGLFPAHHVGRQYLLVGATVGIILVRPPQGHIPDHAGIRDSSSHDSAQRRGKWGFRFSDIKILRISHAHFRSRCGCGRINTLTVPKYMVMDFRMCRCESGGQERLFFGPTLRDGFIPAAASDRRSCTNGDKVKAWAIVLRTATT